MTDDYIGLADAARLLRGRGGKHPHVQTVRRWANAKRGCRSAPGVKPVVLRTVRVGSEVLTTAAWVREFEQARQVATGATS